MENEDLELLPKWLPNTERNNKVQQTFIALVLIVLIGLFTLGLVTMFDESSNGMKGNH